MLGIGQQFLFAQTNKILGNGTFFTPEHWYLLRILIVYERHLIIL